MWAGDPSSPGIRLDFMQTLSNPVPFEQTLYLQEELAMFRFMTEMGANRAAPMLLLDYMHMLGYDMACRFAPHIVPTPELRDGFEQKSGTNALVRYYSTDCGRGDLGFRYRLARYMGCIVYGAKSLPPIPKALQDSLVGRVLLSPAAAATWFVELTQAGNRFHEHAARALFVLLSKLCDWCGKRGLQWMVPSSSTKMPSSVDHPLATTKRQACWKYARDAEETYMAILNYVIHLTQTYSAVPTSRHTAYRIRRRNGTANDDNDEADDGVRVLVVNDLHEAFAEWAAPGSNARAFMSLDRDKIRAHLFARAFLRAHIFFNLGADYVSTHIVLRKHVAPDPVTIPFDPMVLYDRPRRTLERYGFIVDEDDLNDYHRRRAEYEKEAEAVKKRRIEAAEAAAAEEEDVIEEYELD